MRKSGRRLQRQTGLEMRLRGPVRQQLPVCDACREPFGREKGREAVKDHCHWCGKFRGWLHQSCNLALGRSERKWDVIPYWVVWGVVSSNDLAWYLLKSCYLVCRPKLEAEIESEKPGY